jgi:hypothetical protein
MLKLRLVQAEFGDCFLLEYGSAAQPRFLLIDGGPATTFDTHLRVELETIAQGGHGLDLAILSHVDTDHIIGLLDLFAQLRSDDAAGNARLIGVNALWHNSFARTIDVNGALGPRLQSVSANVASVQAKDALLGVGEGNSLRLAAQALQIPINPGFPNALICADDHPQPLTLGNLTLTVVGPTQANLDELRTKWEEWLDTHEDAIASGNPFVMANSDRSIPNLSSVTVLAEADGKRVLCTGDGRSDHLLQGLTQAGRMGPAGTFHVDVLKVAHHGSDRNATRTFFKKVTADTYVISANGKDDNPDTATLNWIVEEAHAQQRPIEIVVSNETPSTQKLLEEHPPAEFEYTLTLMRPGVHSMAIALAS